MVWVDQPTTKDPGLFVTVAEDTMMRLASCGPNVASSTDDILCVHPLPHVERFVGGMRAVASVPIPGQERRAVLLTGGARGLLRGYLLSGEGPLQCIWSPSLHSKGAPASASAASVEVKDVAAEERIEERVMAVQAFFVSAALVAVLAATSTGSLHAWRLDATALVAPGTFSGQIAETSPNLTARVGSTAALSFQCFGLPASAAPRAPAGVIVGFADGSVCAHSLRSLLQDQGTGANQGGDDALGAHWFRQRLLDAGVNDLSVSPIGADKLLVAAAGDDHAVALALFTWAPIGEAAPALRLLSSQRFPGAHTSAVRAVSWLAPSLKLVTLGLDRRLRVWTAVHPDEAATGGDEGATTGLVLKEELVHTVRCTEPCTLDVGGFQEMKEGMLASGSSGWWPVVLAGRGVEVVAVNASG